MSKNIVLACSDCGSRNYKTTASNSERTTRLELKKYCSKCKNHTIHRES